MRDRLLKALPALLFALAGVGVSAWIQSIHSQLQADAGYTSFCNISERVNCDLVLTSSYAYLGGVTVALWGILFYLLTAGAIAATAVLDRLRHREIAANLSVGLAILGLLFSLYMAVVAFFVIQTICLMCSGLYIVSIGVFATVWRLRPEPAPRRRGGVSPKRAAQQRRVLAVSVAAGGLLVAMAAWDALGGRSTGGVRLDADGIRREKPDFYMWYAARPVLDVPAGGHARGPADAAVTLVEFSDFDCPHCARLDDALNELMRTERPEVRVVFRHFPLSADCNPAAQGRRASSCRAAFAAECAADQGEFWRYQHLLFSRQGRFGRSELVGYAREIGLDAAAFEACLDSDEVRRRVENDAREGARLGVQSTPTIFINGRRIEGAPHGDVLLDAITLAREPQLPARP